MNCYEHESYPLHNLANYGENDDFEPMDENQMMFMKHNFYPDGLSVNIMVNSDDILPSVSWSNFTPSKWDSHQVLDYISHLLRHKDDEQIIVTQENFRNLSGEELISMNRQDFLKIDQSHGAFIYQEFQALLQSRPDQAPDPEPSDYISEELLFLPQSHPINNDKSQKAVTKQKKVIHRTASTRGRKPGQLSKGNHLWEFLRDLLYDTRSNPDLLKWVDQKNGIFRIVKSEQVAQFWGQKKKRPKMSYEKMSRAIRFCRDVGYFQAVPKDGKHPKKLIFKFGDKAKGWERKDPEARLDFLNEFHS